MACPKHCIDCAADAAGYYNYEHYLRANGKAGVHVQQLTAGHAGELVYRSNTAPNAPAHQYHFPAPFEPQRALPTGDGGPYNPYAKPQSSETPQWSWVDGVQRATVTPVDDSKPIDRTMYYDKMDWAMLGLKAFAWVTGLGTAAWIVYMVVALLSALGTWFAANAVTIVIVVLLIVCLPILAMMCTGGKGGGTWQGSGTWSR